MVNVRLGLWETNSSSAHQLVVPRQKVDWDCCVLVPERVDFRRADDYYFGRQVRVYTDTESKLMYTFHTMNGLCSDPSSAEAWARGKEEMEVFFRRLRDFGVREIQLPPDGERHYCKADSHSNWEGWSGELYDTDSYVDHTHENFELYALVLNDSQTDMLREFLFGHGMIISADEDDGPWDAFYSFEDPRYTTICAHGYSGTEVGEPDSYPHGITSNNTHSYRIKRRKVAKVKRGRRLAQ